MSSLSIVSQLLRPFILSTTITLSESTDENDAAYFYGGRNNLQDPLPMHGVPTFLNSLTKVRIRTVSANPLGLHVLLISSEAMLFSYGQNHRGQLGLGFALSAYVTTPTIVTPLLERGGKAICCAAGADHSLVVVQTEGRRIQPQPSSSTTNGDTSSSRSTGSHRPREESMNQQELYGFGGNDHMKLRLVNPPMDVMGDVLLPHRTALHARVIVQPELTRRQLLGDFVIVLLRRTNLVPHSRHSHHPFILVALQQLGRLTAAPILPTTQLFPRRNQNDGLNHILVPSGATEILLAGLHHAPRIVVTVPLECVQSRCWDDTQVLDDVEQDIHRRFYLVMAFERLDTVLRNTRPCTIAATAAAVLL